jgi:hypothetical protein
MKGAYVIIPKLRPTLERPQIDEMRLGLQVLKIREVLEIGET